MAMRSGSHQPPNPGRGLRVAEQLQRELADMIAREVKDPRIGLVTLTGVELTPDYAFATIWYTVMPSDPETLKQTQNGLDKAAGFLRSHIGRRVRIHTTPALRFRHDTAPERGLSMDQLIDQANATRAKDDPPV